MQRRYTPPDILPKRHVCISADGEAIPGTDSWRYNPFTHQYLCSCEVLHGLVHVEPSPLQDATVEPHLSTAGAHLRQAEQTAAALRSSRSSASVP